MNTACRNSTNLSVLFLVGKHSAQWALDDVLIGMNDSSQTSFQDKFDGTVDLQASWYRIQGGQVDIDCLSMDTALMFSENIGMCHPNTATFCMSLFYKLYKDQVLPDGRYRQIQVFSNL